MAVPQIVYTASDGTEQTLSFAYPPRQQPAYQKEAIRHDNISTSGVRESVLERLDEFLELSLEYLPASNVSSWSAFLDFALTGSSFAYYPDASQSSFTNYVLEDMEGKLAYQAPGFYTLKLKLRKAAS